MKIYLFCITLKGERSHELLHIETEEEVDLLEDVMDELQTEHPDNLYYIVFHEPEQPSYKFRPRLWTQVWCPYCREIRKFNFSQYLHVHKCCVCGMSEKDFHIRKFNSLDILETVKRKKLPRKRIRRR